ncbi:unnamed protein product [Adineta steineri]|uniref:Uncharacterized protein n=2 Tax=Adineta steineri TaxID=433720 RepID=A0A819I335_9BILA|nr:unnamed protein product [Adineta steineri]CAF1241584.1 unnamed protein product [Adineta steineri]CAF3658429.1 unnamed protein product [Adineta steineri]CAF3906641.1 unnamed protein product [Adineta steineri]
MCENNSGKCLCSYCSGSIAKGLTKMNEDYVFECNQLIDNDIENNYNDLSVKLDNLNPVQCFDLLDKLCSKYSSTTENPKLDELILKFIIRYRNNGGFFLALKQPQTHRQHLLQRLNDLILVNKENTVKTNLTPTELY